jgi:heme exporter protein B
LDLFKAELADDAFTILRSRLPHPEVWFLAKLASTACSCILVAIASLWMTSLMSAQDSSPILRWDIVVILAMVILGLTSLGTLLAALTDGIEHRVLLFPLIYFPLTTPILLAAGQCSLALAQNQSTLENLLSSWLGLLLIFDAIYVILSTLLFGELLKPES